ncbi:hypothetical protein IPN35_01055 [Candidatus Peregrinibacteria bacterium]|nr:MAG: hypothetical protein IPN35_01055 [Candidatus Peregrinibacteria bacterium]
MANRVSYLNSKNTFWQDIDLKNVERDFFTDGIVDSNNDAPSPSAVGSDLRVSAQVTPDKTVKIKTGVAYFRAERANDTDGDTINDALILRFHNLSDANLTIPNNTSGSDKTYEICCSIPAGNMDAETINATASNIGELIVQEAGAGLTNKLLLATVTVENGFTSVTPEKITDHRMRVAFKAVPKGLTATISEINLALDGILASSFDLNILEDTTVTKEDFNRALTGVEVTAAELNLLHDVAGLTKADLQKLANIDATADEIDQALDGISPEVSATNLNILMGGGFTNLHKHAADPLLSGITESPEYFYLPSGDVEAVAEKGIMTRFTYEEDIVQEDSQNIEVVNDNFQGYEANYSVVTNFDGEVGETYTGGVFDTSEFKQGTQARKLILSTDSTATLLIDIPAKNLSAFISSDKVEFWVYVSVLANADMATIQLGSTTPSTNYFQNNFLSQLTQSGWNRISIPVSSFTQNGSANWNNIVRVRIEFSTNTNGACDFVADSLRLVKAGNTTNGFWSNTIGYWEIHQVGAVKRYVKTDEASGDKDSILSLGNQSRNYLNGIFTVRIRRLQGSLNTGIKWRYTSPSSCYHAYFTGAELKFAKNAGTVLQSIPFTLSTNLDYWLRVAFNGDTITVSTSLDGTTFTTQISTTDSSIPSAGQVAIFDNGNISAFDQVILQQTSITYEREASDRLVKIEENTGEGDKFDGFGSFFNRIATFEVDENVFIGGIADTTNFKTGTQGWKLRTNSEVACDNTLHLDLTRFEDGISSTNTDVIAFWVYFGIEVPTTIHLELAETQNVKEAEIIISSGFSLGWNYIEVAKSAFTILGGFDWKLVKQVRFWYTHGNSNPQVSFDSIQLVKSTGIVTGKYDTVNGKWLIEKDIENSNQYLVQTEEVSGEKILVLKTDGLKNLYQNFTFRSSFNARRGNACGLIFKYQNGSNYLRLQCKNGRISFVKRVAGVDTVLGEEMAFIPNVVDFYHLKVECDSNNFKYYYSEDGAIWILIDEVTTSDFTEGQIGVFSEGMLLRINELFVYEHNQGGDTFYELFYDDDGNVSSIIKKPTISL